MKITISFLLAFLNTLLYAQSNPCYQIEDFSQVGVNKVCIGDVIIDSYSQKKGRVVALPSRRDFDTNQEKFQIIPEGSKITQEVLVKNAYLSTPEACLKYEGKKICPGYEFIDPVSGRTAQLLAFKVNGKNSLYKQDELFLYSYSLNGKIIQDNINLKSLIEAELFKATQSVKSTGICYRGKLPPIDYLLKKCAMEEFLLIANSKCKSFLQDQFLEVKEIKDHLQYRCGKGESIYKCVVEGQMRCETKIEQSIKAISAIKSAQFPTGDSAKIIDDRGRSGPPRKDTERESARPTTGANLER